MVLVTSVAAQQTAPREDWEEFADSRPFPTSRINIPQWRRTDGPHVRTAFREVVADARLATVRIRSDGRDVALGGIVGADGWILTKASRLQGTITCLLADQREFKARIVNIDGDNDLALLKVKAQGLPVLQFKNSTVPKIGAWLATVGMKSGPLAVGVLSVEPREIAHRNAVLGVRFEEGLNRSLIIEVFSKTAAAEAGLLAGDQVLRIEGQPIATREALVRHIRGHSPGDRIKLQVLRGDETLDIWVHLKGRPPWRLPSREEFQNQLGSPLSQRRGGFPLAFQHDTVVKPSECGGPVVNLDGEVVGFNIARAGRTETYAIPSEVIAKLLPSLKKSRSLPAEAAAAVLDVAVERVGEPVEAP